MDLKNKYISLKDKSISINAAYVVFRSMEGKERAQMAYKNYYSRRRCFGINMRCCDTENVKHLAFGKKILKVEEAIDPSLILWENLGSSIFERRLRMLFTSFLCLIILIITCLINLYAVTADTEL